MLHSITCTTQGAERRKRLLTKPATRIFNLDSSSFLLSRCKHSKELWDEINQRSNIDNATKADEMKLYKGHVSDHQTDAVWDFAKRDIP